MKELALLCETLNIIWTALLKALYIHTKGPKFKSGLINGWPVEQTYTVVKHSLTSLFPSLPVCVVSISDFDRS